MSFEYRELTTNVLLKARKKKKDDDDDECNDCDTCGTTTLDQPSDNCKDDDKDQGENETRQTLGLLRQQLRDTLAAG
jgi:hypothetical protein